MSGQKLGQILGKSCVCSRGHLIRLFVLMESQTCSKMGHVEPKTWTLGQILEKICVRSRGHIFSPVIMKLGQNVCLDKISDDFKNGSCRVKK